MGGPDKGCGRPSRAGRQTPTTRPAFSASLVAGAEDSVPAFRTSDGVELSYQQDGSGETVVLLHGWMMSGRFFDPQVAALRKTYRVVVPDLRGCGRSAAKKGSHNVPRYAQDLAELVDHEGVERLAVVGWSMGGAVAMHFLEHYGRDRVWAVGLIDFPPRFEEDPTVAEKVCANLQKRRDAFVQDFLLRMFLKPPPKTDLDWMLAEAKRCAPETACEMYRAMRPTDPPRPSGPYPVPAFLAFPAHGWFPEALSDWRTFFLRHETPAFPASRHCPFLEEPRAFNESFRRFLDLLQ